MRVSRTGFFSGTWGEGVAGEGIEGIDVVIIDMSSVVEGFGLAARKACFSI